MVRHLTLDLNPKRMKELQLELKTVSILNAGKKLSALGISVEFTRKCIWTKSRVSIKIFT
jgi:hypothetical protein